MLVLWYAVLLCLWMYVDVLSWLCFDVGLNDGYYLGWVLFVLWLLWWLWCCNMMTLGIICVLHVNAWFTFKPWLCIHVHTPWWYTLSCLCLVVQRWVCVGCWFIKVVPGLRTLCVYIQFIMYAYVMCMLRFWTIDNVYTCVCRFGKMFIYLKIYKSVVVGVRSFV